MEIFPEQSAAIKKLGEEQIRLKALLLPKTSKRLVNDLKVHNVNWTREYGKELTIIEMKQLIDRVISKGEVHYFVYKGKQPQLVFYAPALEFNGRNLKRVCVTIDLTKQEYSSIFKIREKWLINKIGWEKLW